MNHPTVTKQKRRKMLERQGHHCDCCLTYIPTTTEARHDTATNRMLCPGCMILISSLRAAQERGVTLVMATDYAALSRLDLPAGGKQTASEKRAAGRQAVVDGRVPGMTVEQYDAQFGTGSVEPVGPGWGQ